MTAAVIACLLFADAARSADLLRAGLNALNGNDLARAQSQLESAAKLEPQNARVWLALAQTYWKQRKPRLSGAAAAKAQSLGSRDAEILRGLAFYYAETGAGAKAAAQLEAGIRLRPYDETYYFSLGQLLLEQQKFDSALAVLNSGAGRFDKSPQLELARGVALYGLRRFPEAIDSFLRTIQLAPDVPQPYLFLGRMLDQAEDKLPSIVDAFGAMAQAQPGNFMGRLLYARALIAQSGDSARTEALLRESIGQKRDYWESHFELGAMLERRRDFDAAASELERAAELNPNNPALHYRLARVYDRLGKGAEAAAQRALHAQLSHDQTPGAGTSTPAPKARVLR